MAIDATFWVAISFIIFFGALIYLKIPQKVTEMLDKMINSNLLLLIINKTSGNEGIITGKIFEYLAANVPIVGIGPNDGEAAKILTETDGGKMFDYHQIDEISKYIELQYEHWENNKIHNTKCEKYSRRNLTKLLANFLDK